METRVERGQASEDRVTARLSGDTSMVPSSLFLGLALGSMAVSAVLKLSGRITGHSSWVNGRLPSSLWGTTTKWVKQHGSDASSHLEAA